MAGTSFENFMNPNALPVAAPTVAPDVKSQIESAYATGDYGTVSNLLSNAGITASQADSIWGPGISNTAINLGVNFAPNADATVAPLNTLQNAANQVQADQNYSNLVNQAYGSIGRTGIGSNVSNIDQGGYDYWTGQLKSGALTPENFNAAFNNAVTQYKTANPTDPYTQYVNNYQESHPAPVTWTAPELQPIEGRGHNSWFNPNTGQTYIGKDAAEAANAELLAPSKKTALGTAWANAQKTGDYTNVKDLLGQTGVSGFDLNTMFGFTPEQRQTITEKTGFDFVAPTITDYQGTVYDTKTLMKLAGQLGQNLDPSQLSGGVYGESRANIGFDPNEYERATGMKATPVAQVLLDAARGLAKQGITDLSQLKQGDIKSNVTVRELVGEDGKPSGQYYAYFPDGTSDGTISRPLTKEEVARITRTPVSTEGGTYDELTLKDAVTGKGLYYGDKFISGDPSFLSAGQTYSGPGYTSYGVQFDDQGKPHFRTTGGSSSDLSWVQPIITAGSIIPNPYQPYFQAANAAIAASQGNTTGALANAFGAYAGFQGADAAATTDLGGLNSTSGIDIGSGVSPAVGSLQNAQYATLAQKAVIAYDAAAHDNYAPMLALGANVSGINGNPTVATAMNTMAAVTAVQNNNLPGALNAAGALVNSPDLKLAGSAARLIEVSQMPSGPNKDAALLSATVDFGNNAKANAQQGGAAKTVFDFVNNGSKAVDTSGLKQGTPINPSGPSITPESPLVSGTELVDPIKNAFNYAVSQGKSPAEASLFAQAYATKDTAATIDQSKFSPANEALVQKGMQALNEDDLDTASKYINMAVQNEIALGDNGDLKDNGDGTYTSRTTGDTVYKDEATGDWLFTSGTGNVYAPGEGPQGGGGGNTPGALTTVAGTGGGENTNISSTTDGKAGSSSTSGGGGNQPTGLPTGPLSSDMGTITVTGDRPTTNVDTSVDTSNSNTTSPLTTVTPSTTVTPTSVVTPSTVATTPTTSTKTTSVASPLAAAAPTIPKLDSSPQGLTSTVQRDKKILKELKMLFGTLTPELVSALEDRGIRVPRVEEFKEPSIEEELANEKPETPQQLAEDKTLETKFVASGGTISNIDPKITYEKPGMFAAAPVIDQPSRLGVLRHLRDSISARPMGGLAHGGLPHKYAEATPKGHNPEFITGLTGYYASGEGTGQSDDIDAILHDGDYVADADLVAALGDGSSKAGAEALEKFRRQVPHQEHAEGGQPVPAKIADGEYVFPASFVTALGKGDNKAGAALLDKMREAIREHKRSAPVNKIPPKAKSPLDYLKMVKG